MRRATLGWLLVVVGLLAACGAGPVALVGRIVDENGAPIDKAEVFTEPDTDIVLTNRRGFFTLRQRINDQGEIEAIPSGVYLVKVRKFGYEDMTVEANVQGGPNRLDDLVMAPRTPDISETAPDPTAEPERAPDETSNPIQGI